MLAMIQYGTDINEESVSGKHWVAKVSFPEKIYRKAREVLGDVKVVYVMRNGIEVVNSAKSFHGFADLSFEQLCTRWVDNIESCKYVFEDDNCAVVRHHELVSDPFSVYSKVFDSLGLSQDDSPAKFISTNLFNSSFDKSAKHNSTSDVFNERLKCWNDWSAEEREIFISICDSFMVEYDFERPYAKDIEGKKDHAGGAKVVDYHQFKEQRDTALSDEKSAELNQLKDMVAHCMNEPQFQYFSNPSVKNDYLFIENPKVASTSLLRGLQANELESSESPENPHDRNASPIPKMSEISLSEQWRMFFSDEVFKFTFVRNPYSRLLSAYLSKVEKPLPAKAEILAVLNGVHKKDINDLSQPVTFEEFVDVVCAKTPQQMNVHWQPQVNQVLHGIVNYDFIGRFETLADDYGKVCDKLFGENTSHLSQSANKTSSSSKIEKYYTQELQAKVAKKFEQDFQIFQYSTDIAKVLDRGEGLESMLEMAQ